MALLMSLGLASGLSAYLVAGLAGTLAIAALVVAMALAAPLIPAETIMRLYSAQQLPADNSQISSLVDVLAWRAGLLRRPDLYIIPSLTLNAFAAGTPARPAIAISEGLIRQLSLRELAGVLAHEMGHIRNGDLWIMSLADIATRVLHVLSCMALCLAAYNAFAWFTGGTQVSWIGIALLYLTPAAMNLMQLALSRSREYEADRLAATLTGDAPALVSALERVERYTGRFWEDLTPPFPARRVPQPSLLRTHPPAAKRLARLRLFAENRSPAVDPLVIVERPMMSLVGMGPAAMRPRYRWPGLWY
jgi:heat shock protein HtpX